MSTSKSESSWLMFVLFGVFLGLLLGIGIVSDTQPQEVQNLRNQIENLIEENSYYKQQISDLENQMMEIETSFNEIKPYLRDIFDISVKQHYEWEYYTEWDCDTSIPLSLYLHYHFLERPIEFSEYVGLATDPDDDQYISGLVDSFLSAADDEGYSDFEKVMYVISFVQSLPYTLDNVTTGWDDYPKYPIETLFERGGDCEDTSILVAALLHEMDYDVALIFLENENHCAVGIAGGEDIYGTYYEVDDTRYFYLETTGEGWELGEIPSELQDTTALIYSLNG